MKIKDIQEFNLAGGPSKYCPSYGKRVIEFGERGLSKFQMAKELRVTSSTLDNWARKYPEFGLAMEYAHDFAAAWWMQKGMEGIFDITETEKTPDGKKITKYKRLNANIYGIQVRARFPAIFRTAPEIEFKIDVAKEVRAARKRLKLNEKAGK